MDKFLYKIKFDKSSYELNDDYERLSDYEKEIISSLYVEAFFDHDTHEGEYVCYFITNIDEIKSYTNILTNNLIKFQVFNISQDVLKNKINLEVELKQFLPPTSQIKLNVFNEGINFWILENLEIDMVLDRITEVGGLDNLRDVEKEFLKKYK